MKITEPKSPTEFENYYRLRWEILRKPWNQPEGSEKDSMEADSIHAMAVNEEGEVKGVCRLQLNDRDTGQIRFMAVSTDMQGKGVGRMLMAYMEQKASDLGLKKIVLDARENALEFYKSCNYRLLGKGHLLYGEIQHYKMEKSLETSAA
jgi:N-acetylglutamate synthase-like GNAT family acetyltransferase